jgi:hypothetical protein
MPIPTSRDWEYAVMKEALEVIMEMANIYVKEYAWEDYSAEEMLELIYEEAFQAVGE